MNRNKFVGAAFCLTARYTRWLTPRKTSCRPSAVAMAAVLTAIGVSAAFGKVTIVEIPVKAYVAATVTLSPVTPQSALEGDTKQIVPNVPTILTISVDEEKVSILHGRQDAAPASRAAARYNNGTLSIQLPAQQYRDASIALHSMSGKRVLSGKASASDGAWSVSRANVAPGVYLLSIKGDGGNTYSTRLTHNGGRLNVFAKFGAGDVRSLSKEASPMSWGTWKLTAVASRYKTFEDTFIPDIGLNAERVITFATETETFVDSRDNKTYKQVAIGAQVWMAENLNYRNTTGSGDTVGACLQNNAANCATYGRLYRWVEAMNIARTYETTSWSGSPEKHRGICPAGWHVSSDAEWITLMEFVGTSPGWRLKSKTGWSGSGYTDEFGFTALPGNSTGGGAYWWTTMQQSATEARDRFITGSDFVAHGINTPKSSTDLFVRCLRD